MQNKIKIGGCILAGGKAKRLNGIAKGNIEIGECSIVEHLIAEFNKAGISDVVISANDPKPYKQYNLPIIPDRIKNIGPIAGIEAVLDYCHKYDAVVFLPCDLPNITHKEITLLKMEDLVYATTKERAQPLCATVPTNKLQEITCLINNDNRKILDIWQQLNATAIEFPDSNKFYNVNSAALLWVISGAGRGVGKTTLANKLCAILPNAIYAKYGHGKFNPQKQGSFFRELDDIYTFIEQHSYIKQHIVIEANAVALAGKGDITIFIEAIPGKTKPRKDADELRRIANVHINGIMLSN